MYITDTHGKHEDWQAIKNPSYSTNKYSVFLQQHPKEACGLLKFERVIDIQNALSVIT